MKDSLCANPIQNPLENKWIEIFKIGNWTDKNGNKESWSIADLDSIVSNFKPKTFTVPIIFGHSFDDTTPSEGWVSELMRKGTSLFCKVANLSERFLDLFYQKQIPNRSVGLQIIDDGIKLVHLSFLGAVPPAVEGLEPLFEFSNEKKTILQYCLPQPKKNFSQTHLYVSREPCMKDNNQEHLVDPKTTPLLQQSKVDNPGEWVYVKGQPLPPQTILPPPTILPLESQSNPPVQPPIQLSQYQNEVVNAEIDFLRKQIELQKILIAQQELKLEQQNGTKAFASASDNPVVPSGGESGNPVVDLPSSVIQQEEINTLKNKLLLLDMENKKMNQEYERVEKELEMKKSELVAKKLEETLSFFRNLLNSVPVMEDGDGMKVFLSRLMEDTKPIEFSAVNGQKKTIMPLDFLKDLVVSWREVGRPLNFSSDQKEAMSFTNPISHVPSNKNRLVATILEGAATRNQFN